MARKKVDGKLLKIKRNLEDSLKCSTVGLVWILLVCTNKSQEDFLQNWGNVNTDWI